MKTIQIIFRGCLVDVVLRESGAIEYWSTATMLLTCSDADRAEMRRLAGL